MSIGDEVRVTSTLALEQAMNTYLHLDPQTVNRLSDFSGKVIAIEWQDTDFRLYLMPHESGVQLSTVMDIEPDTVISGRLLGLAQLALHDDSSRVLFAGDVKIQGDVELGQAFKQVLDKMDIDWEEWLSRLTSDVVAHKTGQLARQFMSWWQASRQQTEQNLADYLQFELEALPLREEADALYEDIARLRDDVERSAKHIKALQEHVEKP